MTKYEIRRKISYNESQIRNCQAKINGLEGQISELESLRGKVERLASNFTSRQTARRTNLSRVETVACLNQKLVASYVSGMNNMLNNSEYNSACSGLSTASDRINNQIRNLRNQVQDNVNSINLYRSRINYWNDQLRRMSK